MPDCKGIAGFGTSAAHRCTRRAKPGSAFCWQHAEGVEKVVRDLQAYGADDSAFVLQHLTYRGHDFEDRILGFGVVSTSLSALRSLDGHRDGLSLGDLETLPLEVLWPIFTKLSIKSLEHLKAANSRAYLIVSTSPQYCSLPLSHPTCADHH